MKALKKLLCLALSFSIILTAVGCRDGKSGEKSGELTKEVTLYFSNAEYNNIQSEKRTLAYKESDSMAELVMKELLLGPSNTSLKEVIPQNTHLNSVVAEDGIAYLDFSREFLDYYGDNKKSVELLARYSIIKTLCSIDGIVKVEFSVEGEKVLNSTGEPLGALGEDDVVFDPSSWENVTEKYITLYFADEMGNSLVSERRRVQILDNSMEKTVVAELIKGPDSKKLYKTIPESAKIISVETKEGICFVNLSEEFVTKFNGGSAEATMAIYSIVNSLTELADVDKVQFLVEGTKVDIYGDYIFSEAFERDENLIK